MPTWRQGPERLAYSAEVPHSPARFAVHGLPGAQELPGRPYLRHDPGDFQGVDGEPPGRLPPSGSHAELAQASASPTGRVDAAVADGGLICLGSSCVLHRCRVVEESVTTAARSLAAAAGKRCTLCRFTVTLNDSVFCQKGVRRRWTP